MSAIYSPVKSHPFGDLVTQHRTRKHGFSQEKIAGGIGQDSAVVSDMCRGKRLTGSKARERVIDIIYLFYTEEVLEFVGEANALLETAGMAPLNGDGLPKERLLLNELTNESEVQPVEPDAPLTSRDTSSLQTEPTYIVAGQLSEWKIVHTQVQRFLLETIKWETELTSYRYRPSTEKVDGLVNRWQNDCEPWARQIREKFGGFEFIRNRLIDELYSILRGEQYVPACIDRLEPGQKQSLDELRNAFSDVKLASIRLLEVTDIEIIRIADVLKSRH